MGAQPRPAAEGRDPKVVQERLARLGVTVTPSTPEGRRAASRRDPLCIPGVSLSETLMRMRSDERTGA